jgi:hypothetical protein
MRKSFTIEEDWDEGVGEWGIEFSPKSQDYNAIKKLLEYAPTEVILQILLNVEPVGLEHFCKINNRVRKVCRSKEAKRLYEKRHPVDITLKKIQEKR